MTVENKRAYKSVQVFTVATSLVSQKDGELETARAALAAAEAKALVNVIAA